MRKFCSRFILNVAVMAVCGILMACSNQIAQDNEKQKAKMPIALEDFWITEDSEYANGLKFVTGLEIVLPEEWTGKVVLDADIGPERDPYVNTLMVCEKTNAEKHCGVLFYIEFATYDKGVISYTSNTVLGLYKQGDTEYVLSLFEPHDLQYVEGDAEKKAAYENLFSQIDEIQVVTKNMVGFTPCTIDDLEWLRDESETD